MFSVFIIENNKEKLCKGIEIYGFGYMSMVDLLMGILKLWM
jgi:hypothetical protein